MDNVISVSNMRQSDAHTIAHHCSGAELMRRAAMGVYEAVDWKQKKTAIVCGGGNNGGDGYALAEILADNGIPCSVFRVSDKFSEDGLFYCKRAEKKGIYVDMFDEDTDFTDYGIVVDCIFGTGFRGAPEGIQKAAIEKINKSGAYVVSVDINSGLNGDSGIAELAVKSDITVSIGYYKTGMFLNNAPDCIKKLVNADIGIHLESPQYHLIEKEEVEHFSGYGSLTLTPEEYKNQFSPCDNDAEYVDSVVANSCRTKKIILIRTKSSVMIADKTYVYFQSDYAEAN